MVSSIFSITSVVVILSNTFIHPSHLSDLHSNIQVVFLPPPQLCNHQLEEQLLTLKHFIYRKHWFNYWSDGQGKQDTGQVSFEKSLNIWHILENILAAWDWLTSKTINGIWKATWKGRTHSSRGSEEEDDGVAQKVSLGWRAAFDEREEIGIQENDLRLNPLKKSRGRERRWYKHRMTVDS